MWGAARAALKLREMIVDGVRTRAQAGWIGWRRVSGLVPDCGDLLGDVKLASAREEDVEDGGGGGT